MAVDVLLQKRMLSHANLHQRVTFDGFAAEYLDEHGEEGLRRRSSGIIFLTGHMGNWELSSGVFGLMSSRHVPEGEVSAIGRRLLISIGQSFRTPLNKHNQQVMSEIWL